MYNINQIQHRISADKPLSNSNTNSSFKLPLAIAITGGTDTTATGTATNYLQWTIPTMGCYYRLTNGVDHWMLIRPEDETLESLIILEQTYQLKPNQLVRRLPSLKFGVIKGLLVKVDINDPNVINEITNITDLLKIGECYQQNVNGIVREPPSLNVLNLVLKVELSRNTSKIILTLLGREKPRVRRELPYGRKSRARD